MEIKLKATIWNSILGNAEEAEITLNNQSDLLITIKQNDQFVLAMELHELSLPFVKGFIEAMIFENTQSYRNDLLNDIIDNQNE